MTRSDALPLRPLALLGVTLFAAVLTEVMPVGLLPQLAEAFGVDEARVGWWVSAYAIVVAAGAIPLTALLARWPRRRAMLVLLLVYAASNALICLAPDFWVGLAGRVVGGVAHAGIFSVAFATAVSLVPAHRTGRAVAIVNAGVTPALALGLPAATAIGAAWNWRLPFAAATVVMLLLAVLAARELPATVAVERGAPPGDGVLSALRGRGLQMIALFTVVLTLGHYTAYTYVTPVLLRAGVSQDLVSVTLLGYGVACLLGLVLAGAAADRHLLLAVRLAAATVTVTLAALALLTGSGVGTALVVLVWGAAFGAVPVLLNTAALRASSLPDAAPAVVNSMFNVGIAAGAWLGGLALSASGIPALAVVAAALVAASLLLTLPRAFRAAASPVEHPDEGRRAASRPRVPGARPPVGRMGSAPGDVGVR